MHFIISGFPVPVVCLSQFRQLERATSATIFCIIGKCSSNISKKITENAILRGSGNLGFVFLSPYSLEKTYALLGPRSPGKVAFLNISSVQSLSHVQLLRVPWTARRSNQSILKEISHGCSLEGLMLKLKIQYFGYLMQRADSFEKTLMLGKIEGRRRR